MLTDIKQIFHSFRKSESGAVTVDWVVLTAAVVALAAAFVGVINNSTLTAKFQTLISGLIQ